MYKYFVGVDDVLNCVCRLLVNLQHLSAGENNLLEIPAEIGRTERLVCLCVCLRLGMKPGNGHHKWK